MDILVIVKQVPATDVEIRYDRRLNGIDPDDILVTVSPYDLCAIDQAVRLRDSQGNGKVTLIDAGLTQEQTVLRTYLAMGADEAIHLRNRYTEPHDTYEFSVMLSKAISEMKYDLILCGAELVDDFGCSFFLGPYLAEMLGLPQVSGVTRIELPSNGQGLEVHRKLERGDRQVLRCPLPCILTVDTGAGEPGYPTFPNSLASLTKNIRALNITSPDSGDTEVSEVRPLVAVTEVSPPHRRVKKGIIIDSGLPAKERMKIVIQGGLQAKGGNQTLLSGEAGKLAENIIATLVKQGIISNESKTQDKHP